MSRPTRTVPVALLPLAFCCATAASAAPAPDFAVLHAFSGPDGACPIGRLTTGPRAGLYGTTLAGGTHNDGTVFRLLPDGRVQTLHHFNRHVDGVAPTGVILGSDGNLYGTTFGRAGQSSIPGIVFRLAPDGAFTVLHQFDWGVGSNPVVQGSDGALYGTTNQGPGTVYRLALEGGYTVLHAFGEDFFDEHGPIGALAEGPPGVFYGVTSYGGPTSSGSLYQVGADGSFSFVHVFGGGSDGSMPFGGPIVAADGTVQGTTMYGGPLNNGTVYGWSPAGQGGTLRAFAGSGRQGFFPEAGPTADTRGTLYGTTTRYREGADLNTAGTVFGLANGKLRVLHVFASDGSEGNADGSPLVALADTSLVGVACSGGAGGAGTVFQVSPVPQP